MHGIGVSGPRKPMLQQAGSLEGQVRGAVHNHFLRGPTVAQLSSEDNSNNCSSRESVREGHVFSRFLWLSNKHHWAHKLEHTIHSTPRRDTAVGSAVTRKSLLTRERRYSLTRRSVNGGGYYHSICRRHRSPCRPCDSYRWHVGATRTVCYCATAG